MNMASLILSIPHNLMLGITGILGISLLIGIHELGHFLFAKLFQVHTPSFSIGFGPQIFSKKIGETTFSLSAIPLGGYVEIAGMAELAQGEQKEASNSGRYSFVVKPFYQKMLILFGGIFFNILFAYFTLCLLFMVGAPKTDLLYPLGIANEIPIIKIVKEDSAAQKAGLQVGDEIVAINGQAIKQDVKALKDITRSLPEQAVTLTIKRDNNEQNIQVTLDKTELSPTEYIGTLGVYYEIDSVPTFGPHESVVQAFHATNIYISMVVHSFKNMFLKKDLSGVGGPIMVIAETIKGAQKGFKIFLLFLVVISINLAVLNLIPLPILDGGQILFVTIETIIGRQLPKLREYIHIASWVAILILMAYLTLKDVGILSWLGLL